jgi:hypothetical protein
MRRRLFNLLAALSLLAGIAVAGMWVWGHWRTTKLKREWPTALDASIQERWRDGSKVSLGRPNDDKAIQKLILDDIRRAKSKSVKQVRWLSADEVMGAAWAYNNGLDAQSYYYVLQREANGWRIVKRYLMYEA